MATIILGVVGGVTGGLLAGPGGAWAGASLGWSIGTTAGALIDASMQKYPAQSYGRLSDLRVQTSSYGSIIPRVWGNVRLAGNVIWSTQLQEHEQDKSAGGGGASGGGGQKTQVYTYTVSLAIALAKGGRLGSSSLKRIYADDTVLWDSSVDSADANIRFYPGTSTQTADPLIVAQYGSDACAFRNTAYLMLQDLALADYGNRIPNISVELNTGTVTLDQLVLDVCQLIGLSSSDLDLSQAASTTITGVVMNSRMGAKDALQSLMSAYAFDLIDVDGILRMVKRGGVPVAEIAWGDMGAQTGVVGLPQPVSRIQKKRIMEWELPKRIDVTYYSIINNFQQANQGAVKQTVQSSSSNTVTLPMSMSDDTARQIAERELYLAWIERNVYTTSVLPSFTYLAPADPVLVDIDGTGNMVRCRVDSMELGIFGEIRLTLVVDDETAYIQVPVSSAPVTPVVQPSKVPTYFFAWGGKEIQDADLSVPGIYVACTGADGWRGAAIYVSTDGGTTYVLMDTTAARSTFGLLQSALAAPGSLNGNGFDATHTFSVFVKGNQMVSTSEALVKSGQGNYGIVTTVDQSVSNAVNYEIIGFAGVSLTSTMTFTLSDLLRAQRTTLGAAHASGNMFVRLDPSIKRIALPNLSVSGNVLVKCISSSQTLASVTAQSVYVSTPTPTAIQTLVDSINGQVDSIATVLGGVYDDVAGLVRVPPGTSDGDILIWDASSSQWVASAFPSSASGLSLSQIITTTTRSIPDGTKSVITHQTGGTITITLPVITSLTEGMRIFNASSNSLTINRGGTNTIDTGTTRTLSSGDDAYLEPVLSEGKWYSLHIA